MKEYQISYSIEWFDGVIKVGLITIDCIDVVTVQRDALKMVLGDIDNECSIIENIEGIKKISITIKQ